jgi:isoprenylcysteine carboxyl methyltransferase (ICMT) family protein YpbQ
MTDQADRLQPEAESAAEATNRPESPVSVATGFVGIAATALLLTLFIGSNVPINLQVLVILAVLIVSMALWSILVERVHLNPTTGLDFSAPRPVSETLATTKVKLAGLYATWGAISLLYFSILTYRSTDYDLYFGVLIGLGPVILTGAIIYVFYVDRYMRDPYDTLWHAGQWVLGRDGADPAMLREHLRTWAIKGFFLALMFAGTPGQLNFVTDVSVEEIFADPASAALWAIELMFLFDVTYALIGYVVTSRLLDAHIRSSNPYTAAWVYALICYPPFLLMGTYGPLDYRGELSWIGWFAGNNTVLALWGIALVLLTIFYAWATVIFGLRFSNLTNRGILTNGPFRYFKHPAYLTKNIFWWMVFMPFLSVNGAADIIRNCVMLLGVNFIYYMRARTEEWHLMQDPDYRAYSAWIAENGVLPRLRRAILGRV